MREEQEIPSGLLDSEAKCVKVQQPKQPTAGDNTVSNYFHPYWAEDLTVVCFSLISGPAAHLIPDGIGSVKHQWGRGDISGPQRGAGWGDKNITGNPPHLMLHAAESWASHLYKQEVHKRSAFFVYVWKGIIVPGCFSFSFLFTTFHCNLSPTFLHYSNGPCVKWCYEAHFLYSNAKQLILFKKNKTKQV